MTVPGLRRRLVSKMTITICLEPEVAAEAERRAAAQGVTAAEYLGQLVERTLFLASEGMEGAILSEASFAKDWLKPEEDEAWKHL